MQLNIHEREKIYEFRKQRLSGREIARKLGRNHTSVNREIKRNSDQIGYLYPRDAQERTKQRKARHGYKIDRTGGLKKIIIEKLQEHWSPRVIAKKWSMQSPDQSISKESIYNYIYAKVNKHLKLWEYLPRKKRKRGGYRKSKPKSTIKERVSIHDRPQYIEKREEFGHFEADLFFNKGSMSKNVITLIERKSRMIKLIKNKSKNSEHTMTKIDRAIGNIAKTITYDNGTEFANHYKLQKKHIKSYFCDPGSPWQKGSVENVHSIIRRFIPFSMPYNQITQRMLNQCANIINNIPREILGFLSPSQVFHQSLFSSESRMKPAQPAVEAKL